MLFRRGRFSPAVVFAFFGALSSVTTQVAHGFAHEHAARDGIHAVSHEPTSAAEIRGAEAGHASDHAILHEADNATRQSSISVHMLADASDRASSEVTSVLDRDPPRHTVFDKPPPREIVRADSPRAPPA